MSNAPREARSFETIDKETFRRLADVALEKLNDAFERRPEKRETYEKHLLGICLCQGAADHFVNPNPLSGMGIHDFDLWAFYASQQGASFWNRKASTSDFGSSRFGRSPLDASHYAGRRIDVFWRAIAVQNGMPSTAAIYEWITRSDLDSANALRKNSVVLVWPKEDAGLVIWTPNNEFKANSR